MSYQYFQDYYGLKIFTRMAVRFDGRPAKVVGPSGQYLLLHYDDEPEPCDIPHHPTYRMEYLDDPKEQS